jgi:hypothetical protein
MLQFSVWQLQERLQCFVSVISWVICLNKNCIAAVNRISIELA